MNLNGVSWFCCGWLGSRGWFFFNIVLVFPVFIVICWFFLFRLILCKDCPWVESRPDWRTVRSRSWSESLVDRSFNDWSDWSSERGGGDSFDDGLLSESLDNWSLSDNRCWSNSFDNRSDGSYLSRSLPNLLRSRSNNSC